MPVILRVIGNVLERSEVPDLGLDVASELGFPLVTVGQQLFLIVEKLFVANGSVLVVRTLYDSIDWTGLLAEAAVDAFGHVDVVASGSA